MIELPPNIKKTATGRYQVITYVNREKKKQSFDTIQSALDFNNFKKSEKIKKAFLGDADERNNAVSITELIEQYKEEVKKSPDSIKRDNYILPRIVSWLSKHKAKYASHITKSLISKYESFLKNPRRVQRTINIDIKLISAILNHAVKMDRIAYNPLSNYPYKPETATFKRILTAKEIKKIFKVCTPLEDMLIYTALMTGMRSSELCYLQKTDIKNRIIHLKEKMIWEKIKNKKVKRIWSPKWGQERFISLGKDYLYDEYLHGILKTSKDYCFPNPSFDDGRPMNKDRIYRRIKNIINKSKINKPEEITPHSFKHTHVSYMMARLAKDPKLSIPLIMESSGDNDLKTINRYMKAVKNLSAELKDPTKMPWQR